MRLIPFICLTILVSCATGKKFKPESQPKDDVSRLYVYRPWAFAGSIGRPDIRIDGKEYGTLTNGGYAVIDLTSGDHILEFIRMGNTSLGKYQFMLTGGKDHYLRYEDSSRTAASHYQLAADFLKNPKETIEAFSEEEFGQKDAIQWKHVRTVFDPCFYFVKPEIALEEIKKTKKIYPR